MTPTLLIVMPVFNEAESVRRVVKEWIAEVSKWTSDFRLLAINDGSTDGTKEILWALEGDVSNFLAFPERENRGHGQTCLEGYRHAVQSGARWVMQVDSDSQCDPKYFYEFYREREEFDVICGHRVTRDDGWQRVLASRLLRWSILARWGVWLPDANVPYRLYRTSWLEPFLERIPADFDLVNVLLSVMLAGAGGRVHYVPMRFRERYGGEASVPLSGFARKAVRFHRQAGRVLK